MTFPGVAESPNIWRWPEVYEAENTAQDATGALWDALTESVALDGDVVDVGCGDGYHLPRFATTARSVVGVEPHPPLVARARARAAGVTTAGGAAVRVVGGSAATLPLPDACADVVHARTAYFFGPGCEPGLAEADRVLRPGGALVVVDLDATRHSYGSWMRASAPRYDPRAAARFFTEHGFSTRRVDTLWRFGDRATLSAVLHIEFTPAVADRAVAGLPGLSLPVAYRIHVRRRPTGLLPAR